MPSQTGAIGETGIRWNTFSGTMQSFKPRENSRLVFEAFVANELQCRVGIGFRLDPGEPERRLVRAAEKVVEARC